MRIAFVGKGGSGKTTASSLFCRYLADQGLPVLAIDADINQHLGQALGFSESELAAVPALGDRLSEIKDRLRGTNPLIPSSELMLKTTPPGRGSNLLRLAGNDPLIASLSAQKGGLRLMRTGEFHEQDLGVHCYHSKTGAVELILNHLQDGPGEYVVVDMTAGADAFASGLFTKFDLTVVMAEPSLRAIGVYRQYAGYAKPYEVLVRVMGNKIANDEECRFVREAVGEDWLGDLPISSYVRTSERGQGAEFSMVEPQVVSALERIHAALDAQPKDWERFARQSAVFHRKNALDWGNAIAGTDLSTQIDPGFTLG